MKKVYLQVEPGQIVYLVFASVREGHKGNVVIKARVNDAVVSENTIKYRCELIKAMLGNGDIKSFVKHLYFENANIDTGYRGHHNYPVFTTKEKCISWLKG